MIQGATSSVVGLPTAATNTLTSTISTNYLPGPYTFILKKKSIF